MTTDRRPPRPVIFGCGGPRLSSAEVGFFEAARPAGFILFARNCREPGQVRNLVRALRRAAGDRDVLVLIDQEGGRVARLRPPYWRSAPPARLFGELADADADAAVEAVRLNARLIAAELADLGINVNCAPVLDLPVLDLDAGGDDVIGDRAFGNDPELVAMLGRAMCEGLAAGGVVPVIKHIPGHGRAPADSHRTLPVVDTAGEVLIRSDFAAFRAVADMPLAMTAHVVYSAYDPANPATTSRKVIDGVIRDKIGFGGILLSDDIGMEALSGSPAERATAALGAGCDIALHCSGELAEMEAIAGVLEPMPATLAERLEHAVAGPGTAADADIAAIEARLGCILDAKGLG